MARPRLLDLFCGGGGAARGYQLAGFEVTGVDIATQPDYCGEAFQQGDALEFLDHARPRVRRDPRLTALPGVDCSHEGHQQGPPVRAHSNDVEWCPLKAQPSSRPWPEDVPR